MTLFIDDPLYRFIKRSFINDVISSDDQSKPFTVTVLNSLFVISIVLKILDKNAMILQNIIIKLFQLTWLTSIATNMYNK